MIRRATTDDGDAVGALFTRSFEELLAYLPRLHTPEEDRRHFNGVVRDHEVWIYEEAGRILGFAALSKESLEHLYVDPDAQGQGIGRSLVEKTKERRPDGFGLWVFQQNKGARRFYERHGLHLAQLTDGAGNEEKTPDARYEWPR